MPDGERQIVHQGSGSTNETIQALAVVVSGTARISAEVVTALLKTHLGPRLDLQIHVVNSSQEATTAAAYAASTAEIVVAVGGDGTVADVATGIFETGAALGIVPAGSTNITARSLGIPANPRHAIAILGNRRQVKPIDVGRSGDRSFVHIAGAGLDAELFTVANPDWKRRVGWVAYLPAAASALGLPPSRVQIVADESEIVTNSSLVLIANGGSAVFPSFKIYPGISVEDGWLDVLVFTSSTPTELAATLWHMGTQRLDQSPHVIWRRAKRVEIEATPPLPVELDGDTRGSTPREFFVIPNGLNVVVPNLDPEVTLDLTADRA